MSRCSCGKGFSTEAALVQHIAASDSTHIHPAAVLSTNLLRLDGAMITIDTRITPEELIKILGVALTEARDHLEYCGYGDSWERECALDGGMDKRLDEAVTKYEEHIK